MKALSAALFLFALFTSVPVSAAVKELRVYHASFLRSGPNASNITAEERAKLFVQHQAYRRALYEAGDLLMYGPVEESGDTALRGMSIFRGDKSIEEIRRLVNGDPYVKSGVMVGEVVVWLAVEPRLDRGYGIRRVEVPED